MDSRVTAALCAAGIGLAIFACPWAASAETTDSGSASESTTSHASSDSDPAAKSTTERSVADTTATNEPDDETAVDEPEADEIDDTEEAVDGEEPEPEAIDEADAEEEKPARTVSHKVAAPAAELPATTAPAAPAQPAAPVAEAVWAMARRSEAQVELAETPAVPPIVDATTDTLDVGNGPSSVALSPDGTLAYVSDLDSGTV